MPRLLRPVIKAMSGMGNVIFRRGMKVQGRPLLRLTTVGARSGKRRQVILAWFEDDARPDAWIVVGSAGGSARHPGWAYNLAKDPTGATVEVADRTVPVTAELIAGPERQQVWERITMLAPGYGRYTTKTDREIPLFRLTAQAP
jgi:deazaflavin-dependent oxidoreductase (nitroreductase family)